jgi:hypothetical protein
VNFFQDAMKKQKVAQHHQNKKVEYGSIIQVPGKSGTHQAPVIR